MSDFLWCEKYRPRQVEDCILSDSVKEVFLKFVEKGEIPNLLLSGPPGLGKTTVAKALCEEIGADYYVINGSDEGRFLDTVRNNAKNFASTVSLTSTAKHKVIIIDEADNTTNDVQLLLRASIEEFSRNCRFIFTCNYKNKIIEPLHSRCSVVDFNFSKSEKQKIAAAFFTRVQKILETERVDAEPRVLAALVQKYFPDFRRTLNELQRYASIGKIDSGILAAVSNINLSELVSYLKTKEFTKMKKWVTTNLDNEPNQIMRNIYDSLYEYFQSQSIPQAILILGEYQYKSAFVADQEINLVAFLTEIMMQCQFK
jgi:DNA polymerase III delta prime subunit